MGWSSQDVEIIKRLLGQTAIVTYNFLSVVPGKFN